VAPPEDLGDGDGAGRWWIALLVGLLVAGAIVAGLLLTGKDKVQVPNVVGKPQPESELVLKRLGFSTDVTMKESDTAPKGQVTGQDPAGGSRVAKGSVVTLTVSSGPGTARVPDVIGQPRSAAKKKLTDLGFTTSEERAPSDTVTENHVISTRPDVGQDLDKGSNVVLVISSGKQRVAVPKVVGLTEDEARTTLESVGFDVARKDQETNDPNEVGKVLSQSPSGRNAAKGATVTIFVGKEPPDVDVPSVVGQGRLAAKAALEKAGFKVSAVAQDTNDKTQDLHVISQDPASGKAKKGSTVTITFGHYTGASSTAPATTSVPGTTQ
jgi:serine/threonine-protein kinase